MSTTKMAETGSLKAIEDLLGATRAPARAPLPGHPKETLHLPGPDFVDRVFMATDRPVSVLRSLQQMFSHGRLAGTGYLSILPVDQGIEHSAGASFAKNTAYFDPENIVKLAIEGGCNAVASTLGGLGMVARKYAHRIPFLVKLNHNEFLTYPNSSTRSCSRGPSRPRTWARWRWARRSTSGRRSRRGRSRRSARPSSRRTSWDGHRALVLPAQPRLQDAEKDFHVSADLTGRPTTWGHDRGGHHQAEAAREQRRLPRLSTKESPYGKIDKSVYDKLASDNPIDWTRYQVANCYMGRAGSSTPAAPPPARATSRRR
jgi:class I fructose-bisphosphate aldolase